MNIAFGIPRGQQVFQASLKSPSFNRLNKMTNFVNNEALQAATAALKRAASTTMSNDQIQAVESGVGQVIDISNQGAYTKTQDPGPNEVVDLTVDAAVRSVGTGGTDSMMAMLLAMAGLAGVYVLNK